MAHIRDGYEYTIVIKGWVEFDPNKPETVSAALAEIEEKHRQARAIGWPTFETKFRRRKAADESEVQQAEAPAETETGGHDPLYIPPGLRRIETETPGPT